MCGWTRQPCELSLSRKSFQMVTFVTSSLDEPDGIELVSELQELRAAQTRVEQSLSSVRASQAKLSETLFEVRDDIRAFASNEKRVEPRSPQPRPGRKRTFTFALEDTFKTLIPTSVSMVIVSLIHAQLLRKCDYMLVVCVSDGSGCVSSPASDPCLCLCLCLKCVSPCQEQTQFSDG